MDEPRSTVILLLCILWFTLISLGIFPETSKWIIHAITVGVAILFIWNLLAMERTRSEERGGLALVYAPEYISEYAITFPNGFIAVDVPHRIFILIAKERFPYAPIQVLGEQMNLRADYPKIDVV